MATLTTRRSLHFDTIEQAQAEVQTLVDAEGKGTLKTCGNWTLGQSLNHLAKWVDYSFEGVPMKIPFFVRWIMRPMKKAMLTQPMKPGAKIPWVAGGTLATEVAPTTEAHEHFQRVFSRLAIEPPTIPHVLFGPLTHSEWIAQHLRHAELHLSFMSAE